MRHCFVKPAFKPINNVKVAQNIVKILSHLIRETIEIRMKINYYLNGEALK